MFTARIVLSRFWLVVPCLLCGMIATCFLRDTVAQEASVDEELTLQQKAVTRFLLVLEKNPRRGTALDRVYGFYVETGALEQLIKRYQDRAAKDPKDSAAWTIVGLIESQRGRDAAAVEAFSKAADAARDPLPAYYLGQSLVLVGQPDRAVKAFELALSRKPVPADLLEIFQALGRVHQRAQRTAEALEVWTRLEKLFPNDARVQEQIAASLAEEGQSALALPRYEKLIQVTKDDYRKSVYRIESAELKVKLNRSQEAIGDLEKLLATLNPSSWLHREVRRKIEEVFLRTDDQDGLSKYYQSSLIRNPEDVDAMARLARILARQGRVPEAQIWIDKALKLAPARKELRQTFIEQLVDDQRYADAIAQYELLDKADPNNPDFLREWGKLVLRDTKIPKAERLKAAEKIWRRLLIARPKDPLIAIQVADLFRHSEMADAALELYQKAVTLAPGQPQYLEYLGENYHQLKRVDEALATWRKIAAEKNRTAANLARLAEVFSSFGYLKQAIPEIQEACKLDPKDLSLYVKAADLLTKAEQYPAALEALSKAEKLAQNSEEAELILTVQLKVFKLEESLAMRTKTLIEDAQRTPPTSRKWYLRARYHEAQQQYTEATQAIDAALKLEPQSIPMLASAARIYEHAGDLNSAITLNHRLAIADRRGRGDYLKYIAQLETQLGRTEEALKAGRDLIAAAPGNSENYQFYANLCFRLGKSDEGLQTLRRAMRLNPNEPTMAIALAEALANLYHTEEAIELYWQAFDKSPQLDDKLNQIQKLTDLYLQTNHLDKLLERIERIRRDADDKRETTICIAQAHSTAGDYGMARQELERLLTDNTRDTQLLMQLSKLASTEGDLTSAVRYQQQLAKLAPGPESELPLANLLAQTGATQESAAITVRLAFKEEDPEKFLRSLDSLISAGQHETAITLTDARLREHPKDWELLYREGIALAKKEPEAATRRFQAILELPLDDAIPGIVLKNRLAKEAKSTLASALPSSGARSRNAVALRNLNAVGEIRLAVGLTAQDNYGRQVASGRQRAATWTPSDFGQARVAALGWLFRFARDAKKADEFVAKYQIPAQDQKATSKTLWDSIWMAAFAADDSGLYTEKPEVKQIIKRLAAAGDPDGEFLFLDSLQARISQSGNRRNAVPAVNVAPLTKDEIALMLSAYAGIQKRAQANGLTMGGTRYASLVRSELKRAGDNETERKLYHSVVDQAKSLNELPSAIAFTSEEKDVPGTISLFDKWSMASRQLGPTRIAYEVPYAIGQLIGIQAEAKKTSDCRELFDHYFDHHLAMANSNRQKPAALPGRSARSGGSNYIYYWYGTQQLGLNGNFPTVGPYYDQFALMILRSTYEAFYRTDLLSDFQKHLAKRLEQANDGDKVYGHLALAYVNWWNDEKEAALKQMLAASALVGQDWQMKLEVARLQVELQNFDEALALIETIAPIDQDSMRERETVALSLAVRLGDHERARQAAERLFGLRLDVDTQIELARQMRSLGMNEQAEAVMSRVQRQAGSQLSALATLMNAHQVQGKTDVAAQIAYQILRRSRTTQTGLTARVVTASTNSDAFARTAALQVLKSSGKLKEMISTLEEQLKRTTQSGQLVETLSEYYDAIGDQKQAMALEFKLLEAKPDDFNLRYRYAKKLAAAGNLNEACEQYARVLRIQPGLLRNEFYEISQTFERAKKSPDLVKVLEASDLKQLGHYSYVTSLIENLLRTNEYQPAGLALLKKAWEAFPESRNDMLSNLSGREQVWELPEFYQFARQALVPTASRLQQDPWAGFGHVNTIGGGGQAYSIIPRVLDSAAKSNQLPQLREEIAKHAAEFPIWKAGPLLLALIDVRMGKIDAARPILEKLAETKDIAEFPVDVRWVAGQDLENREELRPLVVKFYEPTLEPNVLQNSSHEFSYSPGARLLKLYIKSGQRDLARKLLVSVEKQRVGNNFDPAYAAYRRTSNLMGIAQEYEAMDAPLDAARVYRQIMTDPEMYSQANNPYMGSIDSNVWEAKNQWARLMSKLAKTPGLDLSDTLLAPNLVPDKPVLDLMLAIRANLNGIPSIDSQLSALLNLQKVTPEISAAMRTRLQDLTRQHPQDLSVLIVGTLFEITQGSPEQSAAALSELKAFLERSPLEELQPGHRANARQRDVALGQVGLWTVVTECWKRESLKEDGNLLAARAIEAAKRQLSSNYVVAMHYEMAQMAQRAKDLKSVEEHLSEILNIALARPQLKTSAGAGPETKVAAPSSPRTVPPALTTKSANIGPVATRVPPITLSQFRLAMGVADFAVEHQFQAIATRAMRESLSGGLPVADLSPDSNATTSGRPRPAPVSRRGVGSADEGLDSEATSAISTRLLTLSNAWRTKAYPPIEIYSVLKEIVFPKARSGEIALYEQTVSDWNEPRSLGRELAIWAVDMKEIESLRKEITARQANPATVLKGNVLLVQLAVLTKNDAAAIEPLKRISQIVKEQPRFEVALTAAHAAGISMARPGLVVESVPILEECVRTLSKQNPKQAEGASTLLARYYLSTRNSAELRTMFDAQLQANQTLYSRSGADYALYQQRVELARIVSTIGAAQDLPLMLEYLGRLLDTPISSDYGGANFNITPIWHLAWHIKAIKPDQRYALLKEWTLPKPNRQTLRFVRGFLRGQQIPTSFLTPEEVALGAPPEMQYVSNFSLLVEAAKEAGQLDELQAAADRAVVEKIPLAEGLSILVAIARGDTAAAAKVQGLIAAAQLRMKAPNKAENNAASFTDTRWLELQIVEAAQASDFAFIEGRSLNKLLLSEARLTQQANRLPHIGRVFGEGGMRGLSDSERQQFRLPNLRLWRPANPPQFTLLNAPPIWWTAQDGHLTHLCGNGSDPLFFRYPLTGTFEFSFDMYIDNFIDGMFGYSGLVVSPERWVNLVRVTNIARRDTVLRSGLPIGKVVWNHYSVRVTPQNVRFYCNGHLAYEEPTPSATCPWLTMNSSSTWQSTFRNFQLTGTPTIPREVRLTQDDRLDGWVEGPGEKVAPRLALREPPKKQPANENTGAVDARPIDWKSEAGVIHGRHDPAAPKFHPAHLLYLRPLEAGDTLKYEFLYEPGQTLVHPVLGNLALLLEPAGVRLHWINGNIENVPLAPSNSVDEPQHRRGPAVLPLKPGIWNQVELSFAGEVASLKLNGELILERPMEAANTRQFGLFHFRDQSAAQARNVILSGNWPEKLSADEIANVLIPENPDESSALKLARHHATNEEELVQNAYQIAMAARA
ncbi:MAG: tetratricopeptide repeat protein, partial [Planctomycetaceae bacterium]|nr:tetratricopeptide repeat protein [Planctomycetaceae bacterium]